MESVSIIVAIILMVISLFLSVIPFVPGPVLVWVVGIGFAILNDFERVTYISAAIMTLLMIAGATSDIWMPVLGMRTQGGSCLTTIGTLIGALVGTVAIPIPVIGTAIGALAGAVLVEFMRMGEIRQAIRAGQAAFTIYLLSLAVEFAASMAILIVFLLSVWITG